MFALALHRCRHMVEIVENVVAVVVQGTLHPDSHLGMVSPKLGLLERLRRSIQRHGYCSGCKLASSRRTVKDSPRRQHQILM